MRKTKITSFDQDGVRSGRSLYSLLEDIDRIEDSKNGSSFEDENNSLVVCRLSFTTLEKTEQMIRWIRHGSPSVGWKKITFEKTSGRFIGKVLQEAVQRCEQLEIKQHQRYDDIKWNFSIDFFGDDESLHSSVPANFGGSNRLRELYLTGIRFRSGDESNFLKSLSNGLARGKTSFGNDAAKEEDNNIHGSSRTHYGLEVLELHSCRFLDPDRQYPILFEGLKKACATTLKRLWMPKCAGLDDDRMEVFFRDILRESSAGNLQELGFSYNGCGLKASKALISYLSTQNCNLKTLYLNRQQGELDLQGILNAADERFGLESSDVGSKAKLHLNLSQNYVSSGEQLEFLRSYANGIPTVEVEMDRMTFEVPEAALPGNSTEFKRKERSSQRSSTEKQKKSYVDHNNLLSQDEITRLNVACGRVKYVLGRAGKASTHSEGDHPLSSSAIDCILPDIVSIVRLQHKQKEKQKELSIQDSVRGREHYERGQYQQWLPTFLRKSVKGNIEILKPLLCRTSTALHPSPIDHERHVELEDDTATTGGITAASDKELEELRYLWKEIEKLDRNVTRFHSRSLEVPKPVSPSHNEKESRRKKKSKQNGRTRIPMNAEQNNVVRAAYDALPEESPIIPTAILEANDSAHLSMPKSIEVQKDHVDGRTYGTISTNGIYMLPPVFVDTRAPLSRLWYNLSERPQPYHIPKMIAVDTEWYFTHSETRNSNQHESSSGKKKCKHRSMSVATLQIAYIDENGFDDQNEVYSLGDSITGTHHTVLRSFVIDLLSDEDGFQILAKKFVAWLFGSTACDMLILGFAFGGDLRQLLKYSDASNPSSIDFRSQLAIVESRCLDIQELLASDDEVKNGRVPGLKRCAEQYFSLPLKKDDQCSDWKKRPLRPSQIEYAALDAVILLVLLSQKRRDDNYKVAPTEDFETILK